jgi:hypothetical protein
MPNEFTGCHYCIARGHVYWTHESIDVERHTCFHHARAKSLDLTNAGWIRVTQNEWLEEPSRLTG